MQNLFIRLYQYFSSRQLAGLGILVVFTTLLVLLVSSLRYKEDIADFLPLGNTHRANLEVYQNLSGADRLFAVFAPNDTSKYVEPETIEQAIDLFTAQVEQLDTTQLVKNLTAQVNTEVMQQTQAFLYQNAPYFLLPSDYARIDSILQSDERISLALQNAKQMLMLPTAGTLTQNIESDPLGIFAPVMQRLQTMAPPMSYEMHDGYIFSSDMKQAFVLMQSPNGASETENNAKLIALLQQAADSTTSQINQINIHFTGGPAIAVGNAKQIKTDSIWAVTIAFVLILSILFYTFHGVWNMLLIMLTTAWGWLFAVGGLSLIHNEVSIIVIGVSSVILGIAVNYPLHYIAHLQHTPEPRKTLREIIMPLVVGNITTIGAFLALVPLQSVALRDLGLFASFLLLGTILFTLLFLPHMAHASKQVERGNVMNRMGRFSPENRPWLVAAVVALTLVFSYFSFQTEFDTNMAHINYMTPDQRADLELLQHNLQNANKETQTVYAITQETTLNASLDSTQSLIPIIERLQRQGKVLAAQNITPFISSSQEQSKRLRLWNALKTRHTDLPRRLQRIAIHEGFNAEAFEPFINVWNFSFEPKSLSYFRPLLENTFTGRIQDEQVVTTLTVPIGSVKEVENTLNGEQAEFVADESLPHLRSFNVESLNSALASNLSDNFNYIGVACSAIVFLFLWLSFGSVELAILSFVPMAVSWIWILGIMELCHIQFNIVNIILATFIFGQGDDYTIFITEGCTYEYAYRRRLLASYKHSIILSALIMFIGIGTLIIAKHPALRSLAIITILGMFIVVLMAYLFPPLIFNLLTRKANGRPRQRPLSLRPVAIMVYSSSCFFLQLLAAYIYGFFLFKLMRATSKRRLCYHQFVTALFRVDIHHIPTVHTIVENPHGEMFEHPAIIICNHQSMLDSALLLSLSPRIIFVSNNKVGHHPLVGQVLKWLGHITLEPDMDNSIAGSDESGRLPMPLVAQFLAEGYSVVIFPEGKRNDRSSICRFHKGAFKAAEELNVDIIPLLMHGLNHVMPRNSLQVNPGNITLQIGKRIPPSSPERQKGYVSFTRHIHKLYQRNYHHLAQRIETSNYFIPLLLDRYRYKEARLLQNIQKNLKVHKAFFAETDRPLTNTLPILIESTPCDHGELALLFALCHSRHDVHYVVNENAEANLHLLLRYVAYPVAQNLHIHCNTEDVPTHCIKVNPNDFKS